MEFQTKSTLDALSNYFSNLADNILKKLPTPPNNYTFNSEIQYHGHFIQGISFDKYDVS